ncbi:hypothetical protein [Chryseobacterium sp. 22543]|jgi:hypothetical protein|uniref:hypothetical protein n=1 Tax=Chryseobacterium sp. 22543 TaxID=3453940 RepID=UPI003F8643B2
MTHKFSADKWEGEEGAFVFQIPLEESEEKPLVQVYQYSDEGTSIASIVMINVYITEQNVVILSSGKPFNGYAVVK